MRGKDAGGYQRVERMYEFETQLARRNCTPVAGVDEAGRGPLAGPLAVAAVILPPDCRIYGLNDSKQLTARQRRELYREIIARAVDYCVWMVDARVIDQLNIYQATLWGMRQAVSRLRPVPRAVITDAMPMPGCRAVVISLTRGDNFSASVAAASILAKVERDRVMEEMDRIWPEYGFARHKGYATPDHIARIRQYGCCPAHRLSFRSPRADGRFLPAGVEQ
ncbi:MAG: ribonuclease HII [Negativicutes bacterium]|nr:ribonuclease HII [Negativicutes bacterium]